MLKLNGRKGQTFSINSSQGSPCEFTPRCPFTGVRAVTSVLLVEVDEGKETGRTRTASIGAEALFSLVAAPRRCWGRMWQLAEEPAVTIAGDEMVVAWPNEHLEVYSL